MKITVNGAPRLLEPSATLLEVLHSLKLASLERGIAVCVNGEVVRRQEWERCQIRPGDELEVVQATQGG
ncbi:MAG: sulfur carrier protein ThiS [bacterium]